MAVVTRITPKATPLIAPVDYRFMQHLAEYDQRRYDTASEGLNAMMAEAYSQDFYNQQARDMYTQELERQASEVYEKTPDLSKNYDKVLRTISRAKASPYTNLNKRLLEQDKVRQQMRLKYGADAIDTSQGFGQPLFQKGIAGDVQWMDPQSVQANVTKASDYLRNTEAMLGDLRADAYQTALKEIEVNGVPSGIAQSEYVEALTNQKLDSITKDPNVIEAWKKSNPTYSQTTVGGVTFQDDEAISSYMRGVLSDKVSSRSRKTFMNLPKDVSARSKDTGAGSGLGLFDDSGRIPTMRRENKVQIKNDPISANGTDVFKEGDPLQIESGTPTSLGSALGSAIDLNDKEAINKRNEYVNRVKQLSPSLSNQSNADALNTIRKARENNTTYDRLIYEIPTSKTGNLLGDDAFGKVGSKGIYNKSGQEQIKVDDIYANLGIEDKDRGKVNMRAIGVDVYDGSYLVQPMMGKATAGNDQYWIPVNETMRDRMDLTMKANKYLLEGDTKGTQYSDVGYDIIQATDVRGANRSFLLKRYINNNGQFEVGIVGLGGIPKEYASVDEYKAALNSGENIDVITADVYTGDVENENRRYRLTPLGEIGEVYNRVLFTKPDTKKNKK